MDDNRKKNFKAEVIEILWTLKRRSLYDTTDFEILIYESAVAIEELSIIVFAGTFSE
ncbi:hypothetical protein LEP1GSC125_1858 [Leptospira mayottensis 200901122]|uniref:Uncharacterized protein n=1 Tax=Leptospira mayottensis 200901122 TaxID=1193010 RepID=A0AA87SV34_9LEPT|nr:hypothetical protein LEP1GSC125_1858 [Leptospira mayottensis 200901122]